MGITITKEMDVDNCWANSEQPKVFSRDMLLSETTSWQEDLDQGQPFSKADFERDLRKVSRKVKK